MTENINRNQRLSLLPKGFYKRAFSLAIPIALQNLLTSSGALVDTIMVIGLGNTKLSAIGLAGRLMFLFNVACFGFCSGGATMFSQYWGAGEKKNIRKTFCTVLCAIMTFGLIYALTMFFAPTALMHIFTKDPAKIALGAECVKIYSLAIIFVAFSQIGCAALRATEKVSVPLITSAISVVVNTCLNYILINGKLGLPRMELRGAAIATVISSAVQAIMPIETEAAHSVASSLLVIYGFWLVVRMIPYTAICGIFRAGGDTKIGCIFEVLAIYVLSIPTAFICRALGVPFVMTVFCIFIAEDLVKGSLCLWRFFSRKWIMQITDIPPEEVYPE